MYMFLTDVVAYPVCSTDLSVFLTHACTPIYHVLHQVSFLLLRSHSLHTKDIALQPLSIPCCCLVVSVQMVSTSESTSSLFQCGDPHPVDILSLG